MTIIDWAKLVEQGRAKAIGVSWTEEELKAIYQLKIPPEYVRQGILTLEDYQKELEKEKKIIEKGRKLPLEKLKKEELVQGAKELGINIVDEKAITKAELILMIKKAKRSRE